MKNLPHNNIKKILIFIICLIIVVRFSGCINISNLDNGEDIKDNDILIIAFFENSSIYPYRLTAENQLTIRPNIFNGLVEYDNNFKIIPALSESWYNPNNLTWRFNLRRNVKFHNGYNFTAEDVKFSIDEIFKSFSSFIDEVVIIDNSTIEIKTILPYPTLLLKFAQSFFVFSKKYIEETESNWPIGTGAYKLVEYVENNYTKLVSFDEYWGDKPYIKTVIFKLIKDDEERIKQLVSGSVDIAEYNVNESINEILINNNIKLVKFAPLSTYIIGFDLRENNSYGFADSKNPTSDLRVRKAFYHAIDIEPLINGPFEGLAIPATQYISPYIFGYNPEIERLPYNIEQARDLLIEAGYEDGFEIEMDCITEMYDYNKENCRLIAEQLSEIGINISLNELSKEEFNKKVVIEKNTSLWLVGWGILSPDGGVAFDYFIRTEGDNYLGFLNSGHYSNSNVDILGEKASLEMDTRLRQKYLKEGFKIAVVDDVTIIPLFSQELFVFASKNVEIEPRADLKFYVENIQFI
jgi:peptide/nickel transport system substrate-binding protein